MAHDVRTRLTPGEGRRFGFTVGGAFLVLAAALGLIGDHRVVPAIAVGLGALLVTGALVAPGRLGPVYGAWMRLALAISKVTTPILMGIVYFLVIAPIGLLRRTVGGNPVVQQRAGDTYWKSRPPEGRRGNLNRQF